VCPEEITRCSVPQHATRAPICLHGCERKVGVEQDGRYFRPRVARVREVWYIDTT